MRNQTTWKPVRGHEGRFEVSSAGDVRGLDRVTIYRDGRKGRMKGRLLKPTTVNGYLGVNLDGKRYYVHRLVAEAFIKNNENAECVNHLNGVKTDNRAENLEWSTIVANNRHARSTRLNKQSGERCNLTKYSDESVQMVRAMHRFFRMTHSDIARRVGMSVYHVGEIIRGESRTG